MHAVSVGEPDAVLLDPEVRSELFCVGGTAIKGTVYQQLDLGCPEGVGAVCEVDGAASVEPGRLGHGGDGSQVQHEA